MKKLLIILGLLFLGSQGFCADTVQPEQNFTGNRASIAVQKQPAIDNTQKQKIKNNWFCIIIQVNGKIKDSVTAIPAAQ